VPLAASLGKCSQIYLIGTGFAGANIWGISLNHQDADTKFHEKVHKLFISNPRKQDTPNAPMKLFDKLPNLEGRSLPDRPTVEILGKMKQLKLENIETE
jgi:hypothetical protein